MNGTERTEDTDRDLGYHDGARDHDQAPGRGCLTGNWTNENHKMVKNTIHCRHFTEKYVNLHP